MRVVLDTNVIVAALRSASGASAFLLEAALEGRILIHATTALWLEYRDVLDRQISVGAVDESKAVLVMRALAGRVVDVTVNFRVRPTLPDPDDEKVLEAAISAQASLVTFNVRDFAGAEAFRVHVMTPRDAVARLRMLG